VPRAARCLLALFTTELALLFYGAEALQEHGDAAAGDTLTPGGGSDDAASASNVNTVAGEADATACLQGGDGEWTLWPKVSLQEVTKPLCKLAGASNEEQSAFCNAVVVGSEEDAQALLDEIVEREGGAERNPLGLRGDSAIEISRGPIFARVSPLTNPDAAKELLCDSQLAATVNAYCLHRSRSDWVGVTLASTNLVAAVTTDDVESSVSDDGVGTFVTTYPLPSGFRDTRRGREIANKVGRGLVFYFKHLFPASTIFFLYADMTKEIDLGSILLKASAVGSSNCAHECVRELDSDGFGTDFNGTSFTARTPRFMLFVFGRGCNTVAQGLVQQMLCRMAPSRSLFV
jgi:hypothetical protein